MRHIRAYGADRQNMKTTAPAATDGVLPWAKKRDDLVRKLFLSQLRLGRGNLLDTPLHCALELVQRNTYTMAIRRSLTARLDWHARNAACPKTLGEYPR